ncbi:MAG: HAD family hydrolase [Myxococcales bacterium FL481]|nr:MAG: HAD family hydrolase [Myxococcales bacterium FL481]
MSSTDLTTRVAAFFDVDCTLLDVNSGRKWLAHRLRQGRVPIRSLLRSWWWLVQHRLSVLDVDKAAERALEDYRGERVDLLEREVEDWFERDIAPAITARGRQLVDEHQRAGHVVALLSSGPTFSVQQLGRRLGIEHMLCTEPQTHDGIMTGKIVPPACYGPGKVVRAEQFATMHDIDLKASYFYTDSYSDMPMLRRVGQPRAINPDPRLRRHARAHGWEIEQWTR